MTPLTGETALVTGASRGIGAGIADELVALGAFVVGTATSGSAVDALARRLGDAGAAYRYDAYDWSTGEALLAALAGSDRMPAILVNNAAINRDTLLMRMKDSDWSEVIDTNLTGVFKLTRGCLRAMVKARHGRIINLTSIVGATGNSGQANYAAAKAGLIGFGKSLAREVASRGITVNCVSPGFIDTDMTRALTEQQCEALTTQIPMGRLGSPVDVAKCVAFLASNDAAYITGQTLHVNGGMLMY
ncbi:MAG: 3-oxoacyl-ACP reductase FabG [Gammaproteobacteria bacterium]|nr:3-oxoacyl-ACP reductase FabG [Gammaproteobacteria bacterium]